MITEQINPDQVEKLKQAWIDRNQDKDGEKQVFNLVNWLNDFYEYYFSQHPDLVDDGIVDIALEIIASFTEYNAQEIKDIRDGLMADRKFKNDDGLFSRIRATVSSTLSRLRTQQNFANLLNSLRNQRVIDTGQTKHNLQAMHDAQEAEARLEKLSELNSIHEDLVEQARALNITSETLLDNLIEYQITRGDQELIKSSQQFDTAEHELRTTFSGKTSGQSAGQVLIKHQMLLGECARASGCEPPAFLFNLVNLSRPTVWHRQERMVVAEVMSLITPENKRNFLKADLLKRDVINPDIEDTLASLAPYTSALLRVRYLEDLEAVNGLLVDISQEQKKSLYYQCLFDLLGPDALSSELVEDIIEGRVTSSDLLTFTFLDWLINEFDCQGMDLSQHSNLNEIKDVTQKILQKGMAVLEAPLTLLTVIISVAAYLPLPRLALGIPFGIGGGAASLDFGNPFEGVRLLGGQKLFKIEGFPPSSGCRYLRLGSSATFDISSGRWQDDQQVTCIKKDLRHFSPTSERLHQGSIIGYTHKRKGFYPLPCAYGTIPHNLSRHDGWIINSFDQQDDGTIGFDLDSQYDQSEGEYSYREQLSDFVKHRLDMSLIDTGDKPWIELYPFDMEKALEPIINSIEFLPADVRKLLVGLDEADLTQREEVDAIINFVKTNWTYSLDPNNKLVYDVARSRGQEEYLKSIYSYRRVKCDGAATVAIGLLRLKGIPARLTVGYALDPDATEVKAANAHGWVECLVDGELLVTDPTPENKDQVTMGIMRRSELIAHILSILKVERFTYDDFYRMETLNRHMVERIIRRAANNQCFLRLEYPDWFSRHREAGKRKVKKDNQALKALEERLQAQPMSMNEILHELEQADILAETEARKQFLDANFEAISEPIVEAFYMDVFEEQQPGDQDFYNEFYYSPAEEPIRWFREKSRLATYKFLQELTMQWHHSRKNKVPMAVADEQQLLVILQRILTKIVFEDYRSIEWSKREVQAKFSAALDKLEKKYYPMVTLEKIRSSYLPKLCQTYIKSLEVLQ